MRLVALALGALLTLSVARAFTLANDRAPVTPQAEVARLLGSRLLTVVDLRPDEEFMGWKLHGERRGGHIPGAVHMPAAWFASVDGSPLATAAVRALLVRHGVALSERLVLVGDGAGDVFPVLRRAGCPHVSVLEGGMGAWLHTALPVEALPGYRTFVPAAWLQSVLAGVPAPEPPAGNVVVLEASWGGPENAYDKGHVPGALHVNTDEIEADETVTPRGFWKLRPANQLATLLARLGVSRDATVVVYSDPNMAASRVAWMLLWAGVRDVRLLNGGFKAWKRAAGEVETARAAPRGPRPFGAAIPQRPELRRDTDWVRARLRDPGHVLADVRSWDEHTGKITGYDTMKGKGRIPGARWAQGGADPHSLVHFYEDPDGTLRSYTEVARMWRQWGLRDDRPTAYYCGTGWRASLAFLFGAAMGRPGQAVYDSGWMDWCMGPDRAKNPVDVGEP